MKNGNVLDSPRETTTGTLTPSYGGTRQASLVYSLSLPLILFFKISGFRSSLSIMHSFVLLA